jgi:hypothetical protein
MNEKIDKFDVNTQQIRLRSQKNLSVDIYEQNYVSRSSLIHCRSLCYLT